MKTIKLKNLIVLLTISLLFSSQNMARGSGKGVNLNLTEEQKVQMQAVKENMQENMEAARVEITNQAHAEMATFLTAEQYEQLMTHYDEKQEQKALRKEQRQIKRQARKSARENN